MTRVLRLADTPIEVVVDEIAAVLAGGGLVVVPTDTVYGLVAAGDDAAAVARIFAAKRRPIEHRIAALVPDTSVAATLVVLGEAGRRLADAFWPGALTLVGHRTPAAAPVVVGDEHTLGVRCPDHELVRALARRLGPLAATSANRSGTPTPLDASAAAAALEVAPDLVVDGGRLGATASTVVDLTGPVPRIRRDGALPAAEVRAVVGV
ncbi:MAG: threonylcarbamoyl-AMP synthase [Actinomyces sp.]|nr:MAG: threonylcarbamoyl-AMP synthase [Actinomyces sp.]